jgi:hypothetical protein
LDLKGVKDQINDLHLQNYNLEKALKKNEEADFRAQ